MKKIFIIIAILLIASLIIPAFTSCSEEEAGPVILRVGVTYPEADPHGKYALEMQNSFNARTGGKYTMEMHLGTTIVGLVESLDAVRTGAIEMSINPAGPFAANDPIFGTAEVCFTANNFQANVEQCEKMMPYYSKVYEAKFNQKALLINPMGAMEVVSVKKPIKTLDDWKGLNVQSVTPATSAAIQAIGGSPVSVAPTEGYSAMQKGIVDASLFPLDAVLAMKHYEVAKYMTVCYFSPTANIGTINLDIWNKMPKNIQDILLDEANKYQANVDAAFAKSMDETPKILEGLGVQVYYLPKAERDKWSDMVLTSQLNNFVDNIGGDVPKTFKDVSDAANAKYPYQH